jgi:hypothetical protein
MHLHSSLTKLQILGLKYFLDKELANEFRKVRGLIKCMYFILRDSYVDVELPILVKTNIIGAMFMAQNASMVICMVPLHMRKELKMTQMKSTLLDHVMRIQKNLPRM